VQRVRFSKGGILRLLIVNNEFPPTGGGAGRTSYYLARELVKLGVDVSVLTSTSPQRADLPPLSGVKIYRVFSWRESVHEAGKRGILIFLLLGSLRFISLLLTNRYDLIYYFSSIPSGLLSILAPNHTSIMGLRGLDVPGRDNDSFRLIHTLLKPINLRTWRRADLVTASSVNLAESARQWVPDLSVVVMYNGVDTDIFYPGLLHPPNKPFQVIGVSRLVKLKGFQFLIEAMQAFSPDECHLTLIGKGSYEPELRAITEQLGLTDRVTFAGYQSHKTLPDHMRQADLFVLPSYGDSYASVFLEAMACGLPVVGADSGGARELIQHGENGLLVPTHNVEAIADAIRTVMRDDNLRGCLRDTALRGIRQEHSWAAYARKNLQLFETVLDRRHALQTQRSTVKD
jgi:glycosyltransferase involved in cell wall biosynthesis